MSTITDETFLVTPGEFGSLRVGNAWTRFDLTPTVVEALREYFTRERQEPSTGWPEPPVRLRSDGPPDETIIAHVTATGEEFEVEYVDGRYRRKVQKAPLTGDAFWAEFHGRPA